MFERCFLAFRNQADDQREPAAFVERFQRSIQLILIQQEVRPFDFLLDDWFVRVVAAGNYTRPLASFTKTFYFPDLRIFDAFHLFLALIGRNNIHQPIGRCGACTTMLSKIKGAIGQENRIASEALVMMPFVSCIEAIQVTL